MAKLGDLLTKVVSLKRNSNPGSKSGGYEGWGAETRGGWGDISPRII